MSHSKQFDVIIIGSGVAGLTLASHLPETCQVAVLSKSTAHEGSSFYAQGGVAAVMDVNDSLESHIQDTITAGAGIGDEETIKFVVERAKESIHWLVNQGVEFDKVRNANGKEAFHLTREGGHSHRRIVHAADATGRAVTSALNQQVRSRPNVTFFEHYNAIDLVVEQDNKSTEKRCVGLYAYDCQDHTIHALHAKQVVLATGGASKVYLYSSNPDVSSGDGIAMAWRAGARVANMEFNQFHPTCLYHPQARSFLVSEALRGEGAILKIPGGERFMHKFDERAELAPRDIVARAIDHEMKRLGLDYVHLDISHKSPEFIKSHFPMIYETCLSYDLDITTMPIPVVPAAHYTCGGVVTDLAGKTDVDGLYAVGEVACTGLHGANRMASNSLLECLVFAISAAKDISLQLETIPAPPTIKPWDESQVTDSDEDVVVTHNWRELRHFMWDYVGIVRTNKRLERAQRRVELLKQEINEYYGAFRITSDLLELRNLVTVAELIIRCAKARKESRGLHYNLDYPNQANDQTEPAMTILDPNDDNKPTAPEASDDITAKKLAWACRRGMLELDIFLGRYLEEAYPSLPEDQQALFRELLKQPDPDLFSWLMGHSSCPIEKLAPLCEQIRKHVQSA